MKYSHVKSNIKNKRNTAVAILAGWKIETASKHVPKDQFCANRFVDN